MSGSNTAADIEDFDFEEEMEADSATVEAKTEDVSASDDDVDMSQYGATQKALDATQLYLGEIGFSPC